MATHGRSRIGRASEIIELRWSAGVEAPFTGGVCNGMGYRVATLNRASNPVAAENGMPDLDTGVIDLCRRTRRKWKSTTRPFRHMTSMPPNRVPRRTQDKRQTN